MTEEEKKTKGKGCLITLGVVGALVIVVAIGGMLLLNKAKNLVEGFAEGVGVSPKMVEEVKSLNRQYAFKEPENKLITESQVKTFITIKKDFADKIKGHEAEFKRLDEKSDKDEVGLKEVAEAYKLLGEIRHDFLKSLKRNKMSPREYAYLTTQIYTTYFAAAFQESYEEMAAGVDTAQKEYATQIADLEKKLQDPNISKKMRQSLESAIKNYEEMMHQSQSGVAEMGRQYEKMPEENIALLNKYRTELEELNTLGFEFWGLALTAGAYD